MKKYVASYYEFPCDTNPTIISKLFDEKFEAYRWIALTHVIPNLIEEEKSFVVKRNKYIIVNETPDFLDYSKKNDVFDYMYSEIGDDYEHLVEAYFDHVKEIKGIVVGYEIKLVHSDYGTLYNALKQADAIEIDNEYFIRYFNLDEDEPSQTLSVEVENDGYYLTYTFSMEELINAREFDENEWFIEGNDNQDAIVKCYYFQYK